MNFLLALIGNSARAVWKAGDYWDTDYDSLVIDFRSYDHETSDRVFADVSVVREHLTSFSLLHAA